MTPRSCRFSPPRCGGCSRSCPRRQTGSRGRSDGRSRRSPPARDSPPAAFVAAQRLEEAPFLGDAWFYRALSALGQGTTRLLETDDGTPLPPPPPLSDSQRFARLQLRLTATGERHAARRGRPSRAPRHRPLDRRHPHHARQHLALGHHRTEARSTSSTLGSGKPGRLPPRGIESEAVRERDRCDGGRPAGPCAPAYWHRPEELVLQARERSSAYPFVCRVVDRIGRHDGRHELAEHVDVTSAPS